jgi:hypothetical protein
MLTWILKGELVTLFHYLEELAVARILQSQGEDVGCRTVEDGGEDT